MDHDRHDPMLVAALAAGDLAGTERDQAIALTASCAECAALHDDLVAIARATASVPPPIRGAGRDFRLTPEQAASLRPTGWRRFVPAGGRGAFTRPLGVALATLRHRRAPDRNPVRSASPGAARPRRRSRPPAPARPRTGTPRRRSRAEHRKPREPPAAARDVGGRRIGCRRTGARRLRGRFGRRGGALHARGHGRWRLRDATLARSLQPRHRQASGSPRHRARGRSAAGDRVHDVGGTIGSVGPVVIAAPDPVGDRPRPGRRPARARQAPRERAPLILRARHRLRPHERANHDDPGPTRRYTPIVPTERLMLLDGYGLVYRGYFALPPADDVERRARQRRVRLRQHRPARDPGPPAGLRRGLVRPARPDVPTRAVRRLQGDPRADAGRPARPVPEGPRDRQGAADPGLRDAGLRGRRRHRDDHDQQLDRREDLETTIVTVDLDMLQLVTPRVRLMTTRSGVENTVMYDVAKIDERFGLRPDQMVDYKALKGDPTDNIPGVPGVGEKTAAKLIRDFGTLDALLDRLDEVTPAKLGDKLREHVDQILMGRELSRIVRDLPIELDLEAARLGDYDRDTVVRLFREYEFRTLIERLPPMAGESAEQRSESAPGGRRERLRARRPASPAGRTAGAPSRRRRRRERRAPAPPRLRHRDRSAPRRRQRRGRRRTAHDRNGAPVDSIEPTGDLPTALAAAIVDPGRIEVRGAGPDRRARPLDRAPSPRSARRSSPTTRGPAAARRSRSPSPARTAGSSPPTARRPSDALRHLVERPASRSSATRSSRCSSPGSPTTSSGPATPVAFDTQIAAYILNAALRSQTIADVVAENLDQILPPATELPATARAGLEALSALAVREPLERRLAEVEARAPVPRDRAAADPGPRPDGGDRRRPRPRGARRPRPRSSATRSTGSSRRSTSTSATSSTSAAPSSSSRSCSSSSNLPKGKRTKTGYSTDASVLEDLRPAHPMIDKLLEWRVYTKLRSTYVEALPTLIAEADGRLHTTFHQAVAATGRLSSSDPNLQNIPIRTALGRRIRRAFVAGEPRPDAARRRLLADRAADPRPRLGRRAPEGRVRPERRHPPRDRGPRAPQGPRRRHPRRALDGEDGQLRAGLRDERLRARVAGEHPAQGGPGVHQLATSRRTPGSATT